MHTYDAPRRLPYTSPIPAMRPVPDTAGIHSATPIYDALCTEYRKSFRTLPGDRSGEEEHGFTAFGTGPHGTGLYGSGLLSASSYHSGAYTPTSYGTRHGVGQHQTGQVSPHQSPTVPSVWQPVARQHATGLIPALPPGPRGER
ncbi:hypothetical protein [Streptomyces sp. NBC_00878]|uniref:hypothetical protein n=1 Tax=Streptomyces sp. NBC_00878 TaxID=2975854 RepID=UPI00225313C4|nr:hypothetical protein [Streptomyces sp. NBC_00878]MCX4909917.1 hypothetical protein [Streptomyces sp. NBC_00878]